MRRGFAVGGDGDVDALDGVQGQALQIAGGGAAGSSVVNRPVWVAAKAPEPAMRVATEATVRTLRRKVVAAGWWPVARN